MRLVTSEKRVLIVMTNEKRVLRVLTNEKRVLRVMTNEKRVLRVLTNEKIVLPGVYQRVQPLVVHVPQDPNGLLSLGFA